MKLHNGKYRIVVSIKPEDYVHLRKMAYEHEVTVNELIRVLSVNAAKEYVKG